MASSRSLLVVGSITKKKDSISRFALSEKQSCRGCVLTLYINEHS